MDNKLNSVPSVGTEVENSTKVEVPSVNPNGTKPIVGCSATLSDEIKKMRKVSFKTSNNKVIINNDINGQFYIR
jgi:hypothetical protein